MSDEIGFPKHLWPWCDTCERRVERLTWIERPATLGCWVVLECHGARETFELDQMTLWAIIGVGGPGRNGMDDLTYEAGKAFLRTPKALPSA